MSATKVIILMLQVKNLSISLSVWISWSKSLSRRRKNGGAHVDDYGSSGLEGCAASGIQNGTGTRLSAVNLKSRDFGAVSGED